MAKQIKSRTASKMLFFVRVILVDYILLLARCESVDIDLVSNFLQT